MDSGGHLARTTDREGSVRFGTGRKSVPNSFRLSSPRDHSLASPSHFVTPPLPLVYSDLRFWLKNSEIPSKIQSNQATEMPVVGIPPFHPHVDS